MPLGLLKKWWSKNDSATAPRPSLQQSYNALRQPANRGSVCYAPSVNMLFNTDGTVKACCHNSENLLGKYPEQSIKEIWNSAETLKFRQHLQQYKFLSGCSHCASDYACGHFEQLPALYFDNLPRQSEYPSMMEFLLSNTCNLECVMCSGELSSAIRANREQLPPISTPYDNAFVEQLTEFIPHLHETRFSGAGEAFLVTLNYKLWDKLMALNPGCLLVVQTNGTVLNERVKDYLERGNFQIGVSLDSLDETTYQNIRLGASLPRVLQNVEYFARYSRQRQKNFTISMCVMRSNWHELPRMVSFCNQTGALLTLHKVWSPINHALHNLPAEELFNIHQTLSAHVHDASNPLAVYNKAEYEYFTSVIYQWAQDARQREQLEGSMEKYTNEELLQKIMVDMDAYILSQAMLEADSAQLAATCRQKLQQVLSQWTKPDEQRQVLLQLRQSSMAEIVPTLKTRPVEKLVELSKIHLPQQ